MRFGTALQVPNGNPGDSIASYSGRFLFHQALPDVYIDTWPLFEHAPFEYRGFRFVDYDFALLLCTPWIWDQADKSLKYKILGDFLVKTAGQRKIAFGVGAAYLLQFANVPARFPDALNEEARKLWGSFDLVICRDRLAYAIFLRILPPERVHLMPCPSFYSAQAFGLSATGGTDRLLVFSDVAPETHWGIRPEDLAAAVRHQDELVAGGLPTLVMTDRDTMTFRKRYGRPAHHDLRDPRAITGLIAQFGALVSPRVHACMPALSLGLDVEIVPLDSRALTAIHLGARPVAVPLQEIERYTKPLAPISLKKAVSRVRELIG